MAKSQARKGAQGVVVLSVEDEQARGRREEKAADGEEEAGGKLEGERDAP